MKPVRPDLRDGHAHKPPFRPHSRPMSFVNESYVAFGGSIGALRSFNTGIRENTTRTQDDDNTPPPKDTNSNTNTNRIVNLPNSLSMARLCSGPAIAYLILDDNLTLAIPCLVLSALTDWLDGYTARATGTVNVLGSYLDPLADKVLVGSVVVAMGWNGLLDPWLFGLILGRDLLIITGSFGIRFRRFGYTWPAGGAREFFNLQPEEQRTPNHVGDANLDHHRGERGIGETDVTDVTDASPLSQNRTRTGKYGDAMEQIRGIEEQPTSQGARQEREQQPGGNPGQRKTKESLSIDTTTTKPAEPLYISKVNTVAQLVLVATTLTNAWIAFPDQHVITHVLAPVTAVTTVTSGLAYVDAYRKGTIRI